MGYIIVGLLVVAFLLTYPIGRWQRRRLRRDPSRTGTLQGDPGASQHDTSPIAAEGIMRGPGMGPRG